MPDARLERTRRNYAERALYPLAGRWHWLKHLLLMAPMEVVYVSSVGFVKIRCVQCGAEKYCE